jgi:hypothetical protein
MMNTPGSIGVDSSGTERTIKHSSGVHFWQEMHPGLSMVERRSIHAHAQQQSLGRSWACPAADALHDKAECSAFLKFSSIEHRRR